MEQIATLVIKVPSNTVTKKRNQTLDVRVYCTYQGLAQQVLFYAVVTEAKWWNEFDEIGSTKRSVYVGLGDEPTPSSFYFDINDLPLSGVQPKTSAYGVKVHAEGTFGTVEAGNKACLYIQPAANLTASWSGGVVSYSFSGFQPYATVTLEVLETGGYLNHTADSTGAGSGSFYDDDPPGTYTLQATDGYGNSATAKFTIK